MEAESTIIRIRRHLDAASSECRESEWAIRFAAPDDPERENWYDWIAAADTCSHAAEDAMELAKILMDSAGECVQAAAKYHSGPKPTRISCGKVVK